MSRGQVIGAFQNGQERDGLLHNVLEMSQTETEGSRKTEMPIRF